MVSNGMIRQEQNKFTTGKLYKSIYWWQSTERNMTAACNKSQMVHSEPWLKSRLPLLVIWHYYHCMGKSLIQNTFDDAPEYKQNLQHSEQMRNNCIYTCKYIPTISNLLEYNHDTWDLIPDITNYDSNTSD